MTTRQYIGARYVPIFADPVEWDDTRTYEHLMMVQHLGDTYISKQAVPVGAPLPDIDNNESSNEYWVHMSDWNAQIESYRQEVLTYNSRISTLEDDLPLADFDSTNTVKKAIDDNADLLPASSFDSVNTVKKAIDDNADLLPASSFDSVNTVKKAIDDNADLLPASSFDSVNTVKKAIDDVADLLPASAFDTTNTVAAKFNKVTSKLKRVAGTPKNVIAIGDSFSSKAHYPSTDVWWELLDSWGLDVAGYAANGAAFAGNNSAQNKIIDLVNTTIAATSDPDSIDLVIVYAGYNDVFNYSNTSTDIANAMIACYNTLAATFKCPIEFYINNAQYSGAFDTVHMLKLCEVVNKVSTASLCRPKIDSVFWFSADMLSSLVEADSIHPNADGQKMIAANMLSDSDIYINSHNYGFNNTYASGTCGKGNVSTPSVGSIIPSTRNGVYDITFKDIGVAVTLNTNLNAHDIMTVTYARVSGLYYPFNELPLSADGYDSTNGVYVTHAYIKNNSLYVEMTANSQVNSGTTIDLKMNGQGVVNLAKYMRQTI